MSDDKETLTKKLLFEDFLEWFGNLSREEKLAFDRQLDTEHDNAKENHELNYYTTEAARTFFEENIWPQQTKKTQCKDWMSF